VGDKLCRSSEFRIMGRAIYAILETISG
jgi:hypothetical protein